MRRLRRLRLRRLCRRRSVATACERISRRLGEALKARAEDVLAADGRAEPRDRAIKRSTPWFRGASNGSAASSTIGGGALDRGEGIEVAIEAGRETWEIFGELAAHRAATLDEVTRRCFAWRNVMAEVLHESASKLDASPEALSQALSILQLSLEFSLLRMCECFEIERQRTDEELERREEELVVPGDARPADRAAEPDVDPGSCRADARALALATRRRWRRCSSISTTSSRSTTRSVTAPAMNCCERSPRG